ncbi:TonB-dependent receptor [Lacihabitans soyangensis]|uniref:TonB-dependent receptor plug domain-containing protein n=1 Tax=Lacihabitans soyangensis TaxID=869394 RepID=A0AAE3H7A0_9BACT|nr:TonB-dependent receptor [Lacihabitans soyangensis]MCP9765374.1 hypothetical protein [Lacihabitans soyangensis]
MNKFIIFYLHLFFTLLLAFQVHGQSSAFKITGKIVDEKNTPLEFVNVYINSTSIFTQTDSLGRFTLSLPGSKIDFELVVSMVGFNTQKQKFTKYNIPKFLSIKLIGNQLGEVVIKAKQDKYWWKKWQIFRNGLLGENQFSRECTIENKDNVQLKMDPTNKLVLANSRETFIVRNKALGYKIHVDLYEFSSDGVKTNYSASKYFEDDLSNDEKERAMQLKRRLKAFHSTSNWFLQSLANGNMLGEKFEVFKIKSMVDIYLGKTTVEKEVLEGRLIKTTDSTIYQYDSLSKRHLIYSDLPLLVFNKNVLNYFRNPFTDYTYAFSKIDLPNHFAVFNNNGFISIPNGITFHFHWGNEGLSSALPENYEVPSETPVEAVVPLIELVFENRKSDSTAINRQYTENQNIGFVNNTTSKDANDDYFIKPDVLFRPTELEKNADIYTLLRRVPGLRVGYNPETGQYSISIAGMSTNGDNTPSLLLNQKLYFGKADVLNALEFIETNNITEIGLVKYGSNSMLGSRGGNGTIIIKLKN